MFSQRNTFVVGMLLALFTLGGTALVVTTYQTTAPRILENERALMLSQFDQVLAGVEYDNDILTDIYQLHHQEISGSQQAMPVYRARFQGQPRAAVFVVVTPEGYSGPIKLLVGVTQDQVVTGVRVIAHRETPGLGDAIEVKRSPWIKMFTGESFNRTPVAQWKVKRDGGRFDQLTGATVTPRAIVKAVAAVLQFYQQHGQAVFDEQSKGET